MSPKLVNVSEKKKEIIEGALQVLSETGVEGFRIAHVAEVLDIGKSTIYEYFTNKDELISAALEYVMGNLFLDFDIEDGSVLEILEAYLNLAVNLADDNPKLVRVLLDIWFQGVKGSFSLLKEVYDDLYQLLIAKMKDDQAKGKIRKDITPEAAIIWMGATIDGLYLYRMLYPDGDLNQVRSSFLNAVGSYLRPQE